MSIHLNGQNIKELYYNRQKIKEAYYNGEKVFGNNNVLFEADVTFADVYTLPATYPVGSIIEWTGTTDPLYQYDIRNDSQLQFITLGQVTTSTIAFNKLAIVNLWGSVATYTYHIKITKGA